MDVIDTQSDLVCGGIFVPSDGKAIGSGKSPVGALLLDRNDRIADTESLNKFEILDQIVIRDLAGV